MVVVKEKVVGVDMFGAVEARLLQVRSGWVREIVVGQVKEKQKREAAARVEVGGNRRWLLDTML